MITCSSRQMVCKFSGARSAARFVKSLDLGVCYNWSRPQRVIVSCAPCEVQAIRIVAREAGAKEITTT